ncbi:MAG: metallophosphoesterase [Alphaproteobacteria bacterium]|nr:MAG: metallophosphoesterase [Alphaproteobacteria bacterium]
MPPFHIVQISDPHLSRARPFFQFNWELTLERINEAKPDLVICTGDLALNAISSPSDLDYAREQMERIEAPWLAVPGNHDVGNNRPDIRGEHVVTSEHVLRYRAVFGPDHWCREAGGWTLIGLNGLILGSGLAEEEEQEAFLDEALAGAGERPVALFMHKPLFLKQADEDRLHQGSLYPQPRAALMGRLRDANLKLVSTGHNHELLMREHEGVRMVWCPATSFLIISGAPPRGGGERLPGYLDMRLEGEELSCEAVLPPELLRIDIGTWLAGGIGLYERFTGGPYPGGRPG